MKCGLNQSKLLCERSVDVSSSALIAFNSPRSFKFFDWIPKLASKRLAASLALALDKLVFNLSFEPKDSKIIFSPHAVDQTFWVSTLESRKSTTFAFIWVAKFQPLKRPFDAIDAFLQEFRMQDDNLHCYFHC